MFGAAFTLPLRRSIFSRAVRCPVSLYKRILTRVVTDMVTGAWYVLRGAALLRQPGVRHFVLAPLGISTVVMISCAALTMRFVHAALDRWLPQALTWLSWLLEPLADLFLFGLSALAAALLANVMAAPFNADLARSVLARLGMDDTSLPPARRWTTEAAASIGYEVQRLWYGTKRLLPGLLLAVIPGLGWLLPLVGWSVAAWTLALQYLDYPMALHHLSFHAQRRLASRQRALTFGFGTAVAVLHTIPLVNLFAMPIAVAGATALWRERLSPRPPVAD